MDVFPKALLSLYSLEILDISKNNIEALPENIDVLTSLKFLACRRNRIRSLPAAIASMTSLGKLILTENPIVEGPGIIASYWRTAQVLGDSDKYFCNAVKHFLGGSPLAVAITLPQAYSKQAMATSSVEPTSISAHISSPIGWRPDYRTKNPYWYKTSSEIGIRY